MGCRTEPAAVHIAHVLQSCISFNFTFFFNNLHNLPQKKLHSLTAKKRSNLFLRLAAKIKITRIYRKKKITRLDDFFCTRVTFFTAVG